MPGHQQSLTHCAFSTPSTLLFGNHITSCSSGVQLGGPLSPLLFALAFDDFANSVKTPFKIWCLDNITVSGLTLSVIDFCLEIIADLGFFCTDVSISKTKVTSCNAESRESVIHLLKIARIVSVEHSKSPLPLFEGVDGCICNIKI